LIRVVSLTLTFTVTVSFLEFTQTGGEMLPQERIWA